MAGRMEAQLPKSLEPSKASRMLLTCWRQQVPAAGGAAGMASGTSGDGDGKADRAVVVRRTQQRMRSSNVLAMAGRKRVCGS